MFGIALCRSFRSKVLRPPPLTNEVLHKLDLKEQDAHCTLGVAQSGKDDQLL